jgi:DNA integrity scanning protein DisA with diadenylate cyclase activity
MQKRGASIIIGDFNRDSLRKQLVSFTDVSIDQSLIFGTDDHYVREMLDHVSRPDGALIFDRQGHLLFIASILPFSQGNKVIGGGARHQSTANFTRENKCIGITISEDGGITVFREGNAEIKF